MTSVQETAIDARAFTTLRERFRGALLRPGEEGYEQARRIWNGAIDRRPALIARCAGTDDVVEAVPFARERHLIVSVRGGGHADAERLRVDAESEPDLFWGLRGGGGNFGIATALEYRLHPVGPLVLGGPIFWPISDAPQILRFLRDFAPEAPDELGITLTMMPAPPAPFLPPEQFGKPVVGLVLVWAGDPVEGERAVAPLRRLGSPIADAVGLAPYLFLQKMLDGGAPHGRHYYWNRHQFRRRLAALRRRRRALQSVGLRRLG